jgi:hypothetical protein
LNELSAIEERCVRRKARMEGVADFEAAPSHFGGYGK